MANTVEAHEAATAFIEKCKFALTLKQWRKFEQDLTDAFDDLIIAVVSRDPAYEALITCPSCNGTGGGNTGPNCPRCKGTGRVNDPQAICKNCDRVCNNHRNSDYACPDPSDPYRWQENSGFENSGRVRR